MIYFLLFSLIDILIYNAWFLIYGDQRKLFFKFYFWMRIFLGEDIQIWFIFYDGYIMFCNSLWIRWRLFSHKFKSKCNFTETWFHWLNFLNRVDYILKALTTDNHKCTRTVQNSHWHSQDPYKINVDVRLKLISKVLINIMSFQRHICSVH